MDEDSPIEKLVSDFQKYGDSRVFHQIYLKYYARVYRLCKYYLQESDLAEDVTQEVMLRVFENLSSLKDSLRLEAWIIQIAKNEALGQIKKNRSKTRKLVHQLYYDIFSANDSLEWENKEELCSSINWALSKLNRIDQTLLTLKYWHGYSLKELQKYFSLSESAIKMRLTRGKNQLCKNMLSRNSH